jgi:hypothetical protein
MSRYSIFAASMLALLALSGCGKAIVVKEDAGAASDAAKNAVTASREFYGQLDQARRNYWLEVFTEGPSCSIGWTLDAVPDRTTKRGWTCASPQQKASFQACREGLTSSQCDRAAFESSRTIHLGDSEQQTALSLVDSVAKYQILLAKIVEDPAFDAKAELDALASDVKDVQSFVQKIAKPAGDSTDQVGYSDQITAFSQLLDLVQRTAENERDLKSLRMLYADTSGPASAMESSLKTLIDRYKALDSRLLDSYQSEALEARLDSYNNERMNLSAGDRLEQAGSLLGAYADVQQRRRTPDALSSSLEGLLAMHVRLRELIVNDRYDDQTRQRLAQANLAQFKSWFAAISGLLVLFL